MGGGASPGEGPQEVRLGSWEPTQGVQARRLDSTLKSHGKPFFFFFKRGRTESVCILETSLCNFEGSKTQSKNYLRGIVNGNPLQYSCLENPMDRGAWWATVHRLAKSWTRLKRLNAHTRGSVVKLLRSAEPCTWGGVEND